MDTRLLFNLFVGVLLVIGRATPIEVINQNSIQSVKITGSHQFLPYERLTDEKFIEKRGKIENAYELTIQRFSIPSIELLIKYLDNNTSIEELYLHDVTFDSRLDEKKNSGNKINLPRIHRYQIFVRDVDLEDESEKNFQTLERFLLVEKRWYGHYWFTVQLGSQIYVQYGVSWDGNCEFRYFPPSSLPSNEFKCKDIYISKQPLDLATLPPNLKKLELTDVEINETTNNNNGTRGNQKLINLNLILKYFPELAWLRIKYSNPPKHPITFDLAYSKRNLYYLQLSHCKVVSTGNYEEEHQVGIRNFRCEHCDFEIRNYTNLVISTRRIGLANNNYNTPNGFKNFISSLRNVEDLIVDEIYDFNLDWLNSGTVGSLELIILANLNYQQPKAELIFPNVRYLTLLNINVVELGSSLSSSAFPNLRMVRTTDTNPDLIRIFSGNEELRGIKICFPERILNGVDNTLVGREPRDFRRIYYERENDSWAIDKDPSRRIPYKSQQYIQYYIWTIFIISTIGLIGNLLIMIVYSRQSPRNSTSYIIINLAIHDSLLLILTQVSLIYFQIKLTMDWTPVDYKLWSEKTEGSFRIIYPNPRGFSVLWYNLELSLAYLNSLFNTQSKWIYPMSKAAYFGSVYTTVLLTIERYFAICFPFSVKQYFNSKSVLVYFIIFGILSIILFGVKGFESFYSDEHFDHFYDWCGPVYAWERSSSSKNPLNYRAYRFLFQGIFWNAVMYFVPITLLLGLNYLIWREIRRSSALRARVSSHASQAQDQAATFQITTMLVCVSLVFVICNSISGSIIWYQLQRGADHLADVEIYSCLPLVINSSVNFVIYSLLGKKFREKFRKLLGQVWEMVRNLSVWCQIFVRMFRRRLQNPQQSSSSSHSQPNQATTQDRRNITSENYELSVQQQGL